MIQQDLAARARSDLGGTFVIYFTSHGGPGGITSINGGMVTFDQVADALRAGRNHEGKIVPLERLGVAFDTCHSASNKGAVIASNETGGGGAGAANPLGGILGLTDPIPTGGTTGTSSDLNHQHETWLLVEGLVTLDEMKALMPFVTAGGDVYRAQVVGYFDTEGVSARAEVVIDATEDIPRVLSWRDMSNLGRGFSLETLGTQ